MGSDRCDGDIHPNWTVLGKGYFAYKRFVTAGITATSTQQNAVQNYEVENISGLEAKKFYENTVNSASEKQKKCEKIKKKIVPNKPLSNINIPFDQNRFFRAAMSNDVETLKTFDYRNNCINSTDMFGWTALMMSACENSVDSFKFLLDNGAKLSTTNTGISAHSIANQKGFNKILDVINNYKKSTRVKKILESKKVDQLLEKFYCNICDTELQETTIKNHETSTVHQFNMKSKHENSLRFMATRQNRGSKIMVKQGWDEQSGLGPTGSGQLFPVKTVIRKTRTGLGIEQNAPKVTHYKSYDLAAIKYNPPPRTKTRKDLQKELRRNRRQEKRLRRELS